MGNVERRLELIKMMRDEHKDNLGRIQRREQILYPNRKYDTCIPTDSVNNKPNYGFYIRLGISIGLFLLFFYMDRNNVSYFGISCDMVQNMISDTFDLKSFAFMQ